MPIVVSTLARGSQSTSRTLSTRLTTYNVFAFNRIHGTTSLLQLDGTKEVNILEQELSRSVARHIQRRLTNHGRSNIVK